MSHSHTKGRKARQFPGTVGALKHLLDYDPETGDMVTAHPYQSRGIIRNRVNLIALPDTITCAERGKRRTHYYRMDHLAWYLMTGTWPDGWMERVNGLANDLRIENLVHCDSNGVRHWYGPREEGGPRELCLVEGRDGIFSDGPVTYEVEHRGEIKQRPVILSFRDKMRLALVDE